MKTTLIVAAFATLSLTSCVEQSGQASDDSDSTTSESSSEVRTTDIWMHLDSNTGLRNATLTMTNGASTRCPNGRTAKTCTATTLVVPADCGFECQDGLLGHQGETLLRGHFSGTSFVVDTGLDTWAPGGTFSTVYRLSASTTCAQDPCPVGIVRQKLNSNARAESIVSLDFSKANDVNFVNEPMRGYNQLTTAAGLLATGRLSQGVFKVDRVWRLETTKPACDVVATARAQAYQGDAAEIIEYRTMREAERSVDPNGGSTAWLVRNAESPALVTFTSGINDLWVKRFTVDRQSCAVVVTGEH
jgi:hypothetical protein